MNFVPVEGHILIRPAEITEVVKTITREDGKKVEILQSYHSADIAMKAVNKGTVIASSSKNPLYGVDKLLIYYPFSPNKIKLEEDDKEYHVIHERDVMGYVETGKVG